MIDCKNRLIAYIVANGCRRSRKECDGNGSVCHMNV